MTTTQQAQTIAEILKEKRGNQYQTTVANAIGVSRQIYGQWETGHTIPGDEWVGPLMAYLERDEHEIAVILYESRKKRYGHEWPIIDVTWWFGRPIDFHAHQRLRLAS